MLVCALMLLAAALVGSFLSGSDQKQFQSDLRQITGLLKNARRQAIVSGAEQQVRLATEVDDDEDVDVDEDPFGDAPPPPPSWMNAAMELRFAPSIDESLEETADLAVSFFPAGSSSGGVIALSDGEREAFLYVFPLTGQVIVEPRLRDLEESIEEGSP